MRAWAEVRLDRAAKNFREVRRAQRRAKVCCVVKADAYGHGALALSALYEKLGADCLAVATAEEGAALRRGGISLPVLVLGYTPPQEAETLFGCDLQQTVFSLSYAEALSAAAKRAGACLSVHIKLDTGMGRLGFDCRAGAQPKDALSACSLPALSPQGVFTHFASSGRAARRQYARFCAGADFLRANGFELTRHCANSESCFDENLQADMVRAGIALYGFGCGSPVMTFKASIAQVKTVRRGERIGYCGAYRAPRNMRVATVCAGYADGLPRAATGFPLAVRGNPAPIVGRVCMDQCMLDVSGLDCAEGDEVTVFGDAPTAEELARHCHTISYEILCGVSARVPRLYLGGENSFFD